MVGLIIWIGIKNKLLSKDGTPEPGSWLLRHFFLENDGDFNHKTYVFLDSNMITIFSYWLDFSCLLELAQ